jgi:hypothetical protein
MHTIKFNRAIDLMRKPDSRMIKQNHSGRTQYYIVPGGAVDDQTAQKIKDHPLVHAGKDGLFPRHGTDVATFVSFAAAAARPHGDGFAVTRLATEQGVDHERGLRRPLR